MKQELFARPKEHGAYKKSFELKFSKPTHRVPTDNLMLSDAQEEAIDFGALKSQYEELICLYVLTERQNEVFLDMIKRLVHGSECPSSLLSKLKFSFSDEEGVIIYRSSEHGVSFVAIDNEGDSMFSFSPYEGEGERIFFDYGSDAEEAMAYRLLAK